MALIAVLWIVAAFSILVASLTYSVRQQARLAGDARDVVVAQALADGALQLALQALQVAAPRPVQIEQSSFEFGGLSIAVKVQPLSGLIDLNRAPSELLTQVLQTAGHLPAPAAAQLAQALVEWRDSRPGGGAPWRFEAVEDLLLVPGFDYPLYESVRALLTTERDGGGTVSPLAAETDVLTVLLQGDAARAGQIAGARASGQPGVDLSALHPAFVGAADTQRYRVSAEVPVGEGKIAYFARIVVLRESQSGVPWRTLRTERAVRSTS